MHFTGGILPGTQLTTIHIFGTTNAAQVDLTAVPRVNFQVSAKAIVFSTKQCIWLNFRI
jgi:hypothetical protein